LFQELLVTVACDEGEGSGKEDILPAQPESAISDSNRVPPPQEAKPPLGLASIGGAGLRARRLSGPAAPGQELPGQVKTAEPGAAGYQEGTFLI
jgi:hypothetical protein